MDIAHYTLTGAADWGMFQFMASLIVGLMGLIAAMVVFMWVDLRTQLNKKDEQAQIKCSANHKKIEQDMETIWHAIDECCPRYGRRRTDHHPVLEPE